MTRLNLILFFALMISALGLVDAQHQARKLYIELEQLNQAAKQYNQEYGQWQLEQSTWAMHSRIEQIATQQLQMQVPDPKRIQVVNLAKDTSLQALSLQVRKQPAAQNKTGSEAKQ